MIGTIKQIGRLDDKGILFHALLNLLFLLVFLLFLLILISVLALLLVCHVILLS